jgi:hypothetical protein
VLGQDFVKVQYFLGLICKSRRKWLINADVFLEGELGTFSVRWIGFACLLRYVVSYFDEVLRKEAIVEETFRQASPLSPNDLLLLFLA